MENTHWLVRFVQRLGQLAGVTILLAVVGYPLLHKHCEGTVPLSLGYLAVVLGLGLGVALLCWRGGARRVLASLSGMARRRYALVLPVSAFVLHFAVFRIIQGAPIEGTRPVSYDWVFFPASAMYPPGHHLVMQAVHFLLGPSPLADVLFESGMIALACWLVYRLGTLAFGEATGRLAGVVLAVFPSWLLYANLEYDLLLGTLLLLAITMFFARPPTAHGYRYLALLGLILGLTCLVKPIALLVPAVAFFLYLGYRVKLGQALKRMLVIGLFMLLAISPWTIRNYMVMDRFVLLSTNLGVVLRTSNNPETDGREFPLRPLPDETDEVEMNQRFTREAVHWIVGHPRQFLKLAAYRIGWTWGSDSGFVSSNLYGKAPPWAVNAARGVVQIVYLALTLVWIVGILLYRRRLLESMIGLTILLPIVYIWGLHLVCQAHGQHHLPVIPQMIILGCCVLAHRAGVSIDGAAATAADVGGK